MPSHFVKKKPAGQVTRGKTARNRLRRVDNFVAVYDPDLLRRRDGAFQDALWVDLGYGGEPFTALETAQRWRRMAPQLKGLGVEIDAERVRRAESFADETMTFRLGGFNLPLRAGESVRLVRAFNVLRQYDPEDVDEALAHVARGVLPGGLLVEGTSDPPGRVWVANILRRRGDQDVAQRDEPPGRALWHREALGLSTNFRKGFDPVLHQAVLPKDLIHEMEPCTAIYDFFEQWKASIRDHRSWADWGLRQWFVAAAHGLRKRGFAVDLNRRRLRQGFLVWRSPEL